MIWATIAPAVAAAFLASIVEFVEAFTIILAVATVRGWKPAAIGTLAGVALLVMLVVVFGPLLQLVPIAILQLVIGVLLLLFGLRWLRKAILRYAGYIALHDEAKAFAAQEESLRADEKREGARLDWIAGIAAFKAVVLEGLEVVFIVIAIGAGHDLIVPAALGALAAGLVTMLIGVVVYRPLARVPENTLKFCVGVLLSAFGTFWTGEGLGVEWPGADLIIVAFIALYLAFGALMVRSIRRNPEIPAL
jgi:uncharacterized membrane protein